MNARGFTLVEMLVALLIFSLMSVLAFRGLNAAFATQAHLDDDNRRWRDVALTFAQLERDVGMAVDRPVRDSVDRPLPAWQGAPTADETQLEFSRMGDAWQTGAAADVLRHGYRLRDGTIEQLVWPVLDRGVRGEPVVNALLDRVRRFDLRYLGRDGAWQPAWPAGGGAPLPAALEVVVELADGRTLTRIFALP